MSGRSTTHQAKPRALTVRPVREIRCDHKERWAAIAKVAELTRLVPDAGAPSVPDLTLVDHLRSVPPLGAPRADVDPRDPRDPVDARDPRDPGDARDPRDPVDPGDAEQRTGGPARDGSESPADLLLALAGHGDSAAFAELYDLLAPAVFGVARRVLQDVSLAEEVSQDVLTEVWRIAGRYDRSHGSARAWVLTITHRRAVDRVRSEQAARMRDERVGRESIERDYDVVVAEVERRLDASVLVECLEQLSKVQAEAIQLAYYGGCTQAEVAERLGAPLGTVKTRMRDGMKSLRGCLGGGR